MDLQKYKSILNNVSDVSYDMVDSYSSTIVSGSETITFEIVNKNISTPVFMKNLLVQGDKNSRKIHFIMPRYFDGIDLSTKDIYVKYTNSNNVTGYEDILNLIVTDDTLEYDWLISGSVTAIEGQVDIQVEIIETDENKDIIYRHQTTRTPIVVERTIIVNDKAEPIDYYLDIIFLNDYADLDIEYPMATSVAAVLIDDRNIVMPMLDDIAITQDSRSKLITFKIGRYIDYVDLSEKTICIKFSLPDGKSGDRSFVCNKQVSDTEIKFSWLLDNKVTSQAGKVTFAIEFIGYNEKKEFYCWNTLPSYFFVKEGLDVDNRIEQPTASWIQQWNILADKYLNDFIRYTKQMEENLAEAIKNASQCLDALDLIQALAISVQNNAGIAWQQADRASQMKTDVTKMKADFDSKKTDFDTKYHTFNIELPNLRKKSDKIEDTDLSTVLWEYIRNKSDKGHAHNASDISGVRKDTEPIDENDLSVELIQKINSGSSSGGGSGGGGLTLTDILKDNATSYSATWTSKKIYNELRAILDNMVVTDGDKTLSDNNFTDYYRKKLDSVEENANYFDVQTLMSIPISFFKQDTLHRTLTDAEIADLKNKYTKAETDNLIASISTGLTWGNPVQTYNALSSIQNPKNRYTVNVTDDPDPSKNGTYTYNSNTNKWIQISSSTIPIATSTKDGLMSAQYVQSLQSVIGFVNNYSPPDVKLNDLVDLQNDITKQLEGYLKTDALLQEENLDPELIKKLMTSDAGLINDGTISTSNVYSSAQTETAISDKIDAALNNEVTTQDASKWFAEIDPTFDWSNWI